MVKCFSTLQPSLAVGEFHFLGLWHWLSEWFYVKVFSFTLSFFNPFFSSLSPECREGSAEGLSLPGDRPARISSSLFCSLWSVNTCGILRPLGQLSVPHGRGHKAIAAFSGLNLRPGSEKPLGPTALSLYTRPFPRLSALFWKKFRCFVKSDWVKEL